MNLQSLLFSSEDKTIRLFRRVLGGLGIGLEQRGDVDSTICSLTRRRYQAVILDCKDGRAARLLASIRSAPSNKHAVVAAIVNRIEDLPDGVAAEADFVLCKPLTFEQALRSFRAARHLMKCECRRYARVAVQFPVSFLGADGKAQRALTSDISEAGMAVRFSRLGKQSSPARLRFTIPGTGHVVECTAEIAWQNAHCEAGFRFVDLSREHREQLRAWLSPYYFDYQIPASPLMPAVLPGFLPATE